MWDIPQNTDQESTVSVVPNGTNTTMLITRISCVGYTNFPKTKLINYSIVIMQGVTYRKYYTISHEVHNIRLETRDINSLQLGISTPTRPKGTDDLCIVMIGRNDSQATGELFTLSMLHYLATNHLWTQLRPQQWSESYSQTDFSVFSTNSI